QTMKIAVNVDTKPEASENYDIRHCYATSVDTIAHALGTGMIMNDDAAPAAGSVAINDVQMTEGNNGTQLENFTVTRTGGNAAFDVNLDRKGGVEGKGDDVDGARTVKEKFDARVNRQTIQNTGKDSNKPE